MTPDERDRLAKLEQKVTSLEDWLRSIHGELKELNKAAHMGKGAWWLILRIGAVLLALGTAGAWVFDRWPKK
jgi:hypothetical protein